MSKSKTLILIDGHALAFRQYYALEKSNMQTKDNVPTWAVFGFFKAIFDLLKNKDINADAIAVAFDVSHHTFRTEKYEDYKANREAMPDNMQVQMELIYEGLKAFNIPIYTKEGFEADDVIGTISKKACELGHKVLILTGDQDAFQLIRKDGCIRVIIPFKGELLDYDWDKVYEKLGVYPDQVIDYKALRGDSSDNIPGIRGIGVKSATSLLSEFKTVDNVLANIDNISSKSIREKIREGIEQAKLSKYLATIVTDVDLDFDFDKTNIELPNIANVTEFLRKMQFYSFLKNIEIILKSFNKGKSPKNIDLSDKSGYIENIEPVAPNGQLGLFTQSIQAEINKSDFGYGLHIVQDSYSFENMIKDLSKQNVFAFKSFYSIKNAVNFQLYGICFGINSDFKYGNRKLNILEENSIAKVYFIPLNMNSNEGLKIDYVISNLKNIMEDNKIKKLVHDTKSECNIFRNYGVNISGIVFDTMLASYIKNSSSSNDLDIQCMERIEHILPTIVSASKQSLFVVAGLDDVKDYCAEVVTGLFKLTKYWLNNLDEPEYNLLQNIEIPLGYVLSDMELNGVCIDREYLKYLTQQFNDKIQSLERRIFEIAGTDFNINSPRQVAYVLFDLLKLRVPGKKNSSRVKKSTGADVLAILSKKHEIAQNILDYRKYARLKSTYTEALIELINPKDDRIHTTFNQTVTATGRLSSSSPNLQNIPARTEVGNNIRKAFVPKDKENYLILSADYSQIELRVLAHVSQDKNMLESFKSGKDIHTLTASKVFGVKVPEVTKEMRIQAKAVNFGIVYGQTRYGLAKALDINPEVAQTFIDKYLSTYPKIKKYMRETREFVEKEGYVQTIFGRKRYLDNEINSGNAMIREFAKRAAINHPIQGSASDIMKMAMIEFNKKLKENNLKSKMILQVHDEIVVETAKDELEIVKKLVTDAMELNQPLRVPLIVDIHIGESWKE